MVEGGGLIMIDCFASRQHWTHPLVGGHSTRASWPLPSWLSVPLEVPFVPSAKGVITLPLPVPWHTSSSSLTRIAHPLVLPSLPGVTRLYAGLGIVVAVHSQVLGHVSAGMCVQPVAAVIIGLETAETPPLSLDSNAYHPGQPVLPVRLPPRGPRHRRHLKSSNHL